jgi:hypothetical protein
VQSVTSREISLAYTSPFEHGSQHLVLSTSQAWLGTAMRLQVFGRFVVLYHLLFLVPFDVASCSIDTAQAESVNNNKYEYLDSQKQLMHTIIYMIKEYCCLFRPFLILETRNMTGRTYCAHTLILFREIRQFSKNQLRGVVINARCFRMLAGYLFPRRRLAISCIVFTISIELSPLKLSLEYTIIMSMVVVLVTGGFVQKSDSGKLQVNLAYDIFALGNHKLILFMVHIHYSNDFRKLLSYCISCNFSHDSFKILQLEHNQE